MKAFLISENHEASEDSSCGCLPDLQTQEKIKDKAESPNLEAHGEVSHGIALVLLTNSSCEEKSFNLQQVPVLDEV